MEAGAEIADLWAGSADVVVLTGAGISTDSGIPDFRGPDGIWTRNPAAEAMFDIDTYVRDPQVRRIAWANRRAHPAWTASPNDGHRALATLQSAGRVSRLMTQNIDGLHQRAGSTDVLELHGTVWQAACLSCGVRMPMAEVLERPEDDPHCLSCGGILKSATFSFGQPLDADVLGAAFEAASSADLLVAIGTSLRVQPVASLAGYAQALAIINAEPTPYDRIADVIVRDGISGVLRSIVGALGEGRPAL